LDNEGVRKNIGKRDLILLSILFLFLFNVGMVFVSAKSDLKNNTDDYLDTTKMGKTVDVSRNATDSINLKWLPYPPYQDLTTWIENDAAGVLTVTSSRCTMVNMVTIYHNVALYKDYGADYFGDFEVQFTFCATREGKHTTVLYRYSIINFANHVGDFYDITTEATLTLLFKAVASSTTLYNLSLVTRDDAGTPTYYDSGVNLNINTVYYVTVKRIGDFYLVVYDNPSRTHEVFSLQAYTSTPATTFRYVWVAGSLGAPSGISNQNNGYIENLRVTTGLGRYAVTGYYISKKAINTGDIGKYFVMNVTIPTNTYMKIYFSDDNSTWSTPIQYGTSRLEVVDISDYTSALYVKVELFRFAVYYFVTPTVDFIEVIYLPAVVSKFSTGLFVGLFGTFMAGVLMIATRKR
jgi:hypothetical protein